MILDSLANAAAYRSLTPRLSAAFDFLSDPANHTLSLGRHAIDGDRLFAIVMRYSTKPPTETFWEAHRRYIDVQCMIDGMEAMRWAPMERMKAVTDYDAEKDFIKFEGVGTEFAVEADQFAVFWPHDVHMPSLLIGRSKAVKKIVLKVAVE